MRVPAWAYAARAYVLGGGTSDGEAARRVTPDPTPESLLTVSMIAGMAVRLQLWPRTELQRAVMNSDAGGRASDTAASRTLFGVMHGPLLLAALTEGDRLVRASSSANVASPPAWLMPVTAAARKELHALVLVGSNGPSCPTPSTGVPSLLMMHDGVGKQVVARRRPTQPPAVAPRVGGSDDVNAATWRITPAPVGETPRDAAGSASVREVVLESYDRPGQVLTLQAAGDGSPYRPLLLEAALPRRAGAHQRWLLRPHEKCRQMGGDSPESAVVLLESAAEQGLFVAFPSDATSDASAYMQRAPLLEAAADVEGAAVFRLSAPLARYPPVAWWAATNASSHRDPPLRSKHFLMLPLRDLIDETYAAHLCVLPAHASVPEFC